MSVILLTIDPQVDFCNPNGALYVPGAEKDIQRLSKMIVENIPEISMINVTLDSHHFVHIAHPVWWVDKNNNHPDPFTVITVGDVEQGKWKAYNPNMQKWSLEYVTKLRDNPVMTGYFLGGKDSVGVTADIESLGFSNEVVRALSATLDTARTGEQGISSFLKGYKIGGYDSTWSAVIEDLNFSDETSNVLSNDLTVAILLPGVSQNAENGYRLGGNVFVQTSAITKIVFSTETNANISETISQAKASMGSVTSNLKAYILGGSDSVPAYLTEIESFEFRMN